MGIEKIHLKHLLAAFFGTIVEYYDYGLYGFAAFILKDQFFPQAGENLGLLYALGIFAVGYLSKPMGAVIFGSIGDQFGRKLSLYITIVGMSIPTFIIGVLPGFQEIGIAAPILVILCRFLQGIFAGGEYDGAVLYVLEHIGSKNKGLGSALTRATGVLGLILGSSMVHLCTQPGLPTWFWRVPFCLSVPLAILTLTLRLQMQETPEFNNIAKSEKKLGLKSVLRQHKFSIFLVVLLTGTVGGSYQFIFVFVKNVLSAIDSELAKGINSLHPFALLFFGVSMIFSGIYADRIGVERLMKWGLFCGTVTSFGLLFALETKNRTGTYIFYLLTAIAIAPFNCLAHGLVYRFFPAAARYRGVSIGHNLGSMLLSGSTPFLAMSLYHVSNALSLAFLYLLGLLLLMWIIIELSTKQIKTAAKIPKKQELRSLA